MFKRILVPLDGSERAERALPVATRLARASDGMIFLVRVLSTAPASMPSAPAKPILIQTIGEADRQQAQSYLNGVADSATLQGVSVQTEVPEGLVAPSILSLAAAKQVDSIVMCSHGYTGVTSWWMMGSIAAKVAPYATVPVLVLREGGPLPEARQPGERPLRILVPLDGSEFAQAALAPAGELAAALAAPGQGALHLLHVIQTAHATIAPNKAARAVQDTPAGQNIAGEYLRAMIQRLRDDSEDDSISKLHLVLSSSVTSDDNIAQGIVRVAENGVTDGGSEMFGGCDVIAMTTHGYSGPQRWMGSVTERVLHTSRMPLFIVPSMNTR